MEFPLTRINIRGNIEVDAPMQEKSWKTTEIEKNQLDLFLFTSQSNIIKRPIAPPTTFKNRGFRKFRAVISLDHETLTPGRSRPGSRHGREVVWGF